VTDSESVILDLAFTPDGKTLLVSTTTSRITSLTFDWNFTVCDRDEVLRLLSEANAVLEYQQPLAIPSAHSSVRISGDVLAPREGKIEIPDGRVTAQVSYGCVPEVKLRGSFNCGKEFIKGAMQCPRGLQVFLGRLITQVTTSEFIYRTSGIEPFDSASEEEWFTHSSVIACAVSRRTFTRRGRFCT